MLLNILIAVAIVLVIGLVIRHIANDGATNHVPITNLEYAWTSLIVALIVVPTITMVSWHISKNNQMTYVEHMNGWETGCRIDRIRCTRDGPCRWSYKCDPYIVMVSYSCGTAKSPRTCTRPETRYHDCPYAREEWNYVVSTTLGDFLIDDHRLPPDYFRNPWRAGNAAPRSVAERAGVGNHPFWEQVRDRLKADSAGPVTKFHEYENYVLASQVTTLRTEVRADIDEFKKDSLLPPIKREIGEFYIVNKVYTVGAVRSPMGFRDAVHRLSSSLGYTRQGDIRIVLVNHPKIHGNPDRYTNTLKAYWQSREMQGNNHALPKNAVVVVIGTDGKTIQWSRAFTGMPVGNEGLVAAFNTRLSNRPFDKDTLIGFLRHRSGANIGLDTLGAMSYIALQSELAYKREHMDVYSYLKGDIQPTKAAKVWAVVLSVLLGGLLWLLPLNIHCPSDEKAKQRALRYTNLYNYRRY